MRKRYFVLILVLLLLAGAAAVVQRILFPAAPKVLQVVSVRGDVTVEGKEGSGALQAGHVLAPGESVRTGHEGEAILQGKGNTTITLSEHAKVRLDGIASDGVSKLTVDEGRVRAVVPQGSGGGVEITGGREKSVVTTRGGDVAVGVDGKGDLSMATFQGNAKLTAGGTTRDVNAGELATVSGGKVQVGAIPTEVLLKVAWPEAGKTRDTMQPVHVAAGPGSTVRVNDKSVALDSSGNAIVMVPLAEGENRIHVEAQDVVGNHKNEESQTIVLDTTPPAIKTGKASWK